jgi:hypothetical protein
MKIDLSDSDNEWKLITIKYANKCCTCNDTIPQGSKELWKKGEGVKHQSCIGLNKVEITNEPLLEKKWHDGKIYSYEKSLLITQCQFCGHSLDKTKGSYMNLDRRCCQTCFGIY